MVMNRLRILFVTEDDPLYVIQFFESFFRQYPRDEFDICGITVAKPFHEPVWKTARRIYRFYGPVDFGRLCLRYLDGKLRGASIESLACKNGVAHLPTASVNDPDYIDRVRLLSPDVIASVAAPEIFRKKFLAAAKLRCINIHSGHLPQYRGMMPTFWQMLNRESYATITVHDMVPKLDAGDVLGTKAIPLNRCDSLDRVITRTKQAGAALMIDVLKQLAEGRVDPQPLDMSQAGYYSFPRPSDVKAFRALGHRML